LLEEFPKCVGRNGNALESAAMTRIEGKTEGKK